MRDVAVVAFAEAPNVRQTDGTTNGVEMLVPIFREVFGQTGLTKGDIGFWCSGSSDYLAGRAFSFVSAVDAIGAFPPVMESHVEMDGAFALYEAWVKVLTGDADIALAYGFGKSSAGDLRRVLALQLDPYVVAPLWPDSVSIAALQARLGLDKNLWTERAMAQVAAASRTAALSNARAQLSGAADVDDLLAAPYVAELHAPFTHQELILRAALGLGDAVRISPSGGALAGNPMFAAGLARIGHAARAISSGAADRALGHATSGPALQQNLVCVMAAR